MYAAAGGASLAHRQARKRQAAQDTKDKAKLRSMKEKEALEIKVDPLPQSKSRQFHQLPAEYLKAPHIGHDRKFSVGYTGNSKQLLPISEQDAHLHSSQNPLHLHPAPKSQKEPQYELVGTKTQLRYGMGHRKLIKSATSTLPLGKKNSYSYVY